LPVSFACSIVCGKTKGIFFEKTGSDTGNVSGKHSLELIQNAIRLIGFTDKKVRIIEDYVSVIQFIVGEYLLLLLTDCHVM
jgi:hypothetical protein